MVTAAGIDRTDVRSLSLTYYDGHLVHAHRHKWAQLITTRSGMIQVTAGGKLWMVPPSKAIWIPAGVEHHFTVRGEVSFRTLYVAPERAKAVERDLRTLELTPLLRELVLHIVKFESLSPEVATQERLASVLVDLIDAAASIDLMLPLPSDSRALRLAEHFQTHPSDTADISTLAVESGASVRTLQRCFSFETGMTVNAWRSKARLILSTAALSEGISVTQTALDVGYDSPSAFIAAFKKQFDVTPGGYGRGK